MSTTICISAACRRDTIPASKLWGHALRDLIEDPLIVDQTAEGEPLLLDDWRLEKLARAASKASAVQP